MLYAHFSEVPPGRWRWPNFAAAEPNLACPCCGAFFLDETAMDRLQAARTAAGRAFRINSGHRCPIHNARVGGAPMSQHKRIAFDISLRGHKPAGLLAACRRAGFTGFGFYRTFLHVDTRLRRCQWMTKGGRGTWRNLVR